MQTPTATSSWGKVGGRIVPKNVEELFVLHVWLVSHQITVAPDEWRADLNMIVQALGWPRSDDTRQAVADMILSEAAHALAVAS
jgi:hypothetical protein